ncbi:hypothetical protein CY34DRAFT_91776, partial [Suillus luteus UH-Slu-Lm8-n1]
RPHCVQTSPSAHYHITISAHATYDLTAWLGRLGDDPAVTIYFASHYHQIIPLVCLQGLVYEGDEYEFMDTEYNLVLITDNKMFEYSVLRVNYTTYNLRREQDSINPCTCTDLMVMSHKEEHTHPQEVSKRQMPDIRLNITKLLNLNVLPHELSKQEVLSFSIVASVLHQIIS